MVYWWIYYMGLHKSLLHPRWNIFTLNLLLFQLKNPAMTPSTPPLAFHSAWALSPSLVWCCWVWPSSCLAASTCGSSDMSASDVVSLLQWTVNQKPWLGWCEVSATKVFIGISASFTYVQRSCNTGYFTSKNWNCSDLWHCTCKRTGTLYKRLQYVIENFRFFLFNPFIFIYPSIHLLLSPFILHSGLRATEAYPSYLRAKVGKTLDKSPAYCRASTNICCCYIIIIL